MNKFICLGRLTRDPEITTSSSGTDIAKYAVAVERKFKREGQPTADFFNCTSFGKQAEFVGKYLKKGSKVILSGSIQIDSYTSKTGEKKTSINVTVEEIEFAESKASTDPVEQAKKTDFLQVPDTLIEELPFS